MMARSVAAERTMVDTGGQPAGLTLGEAAGRFGVSERTLRRWLAATAPGERVARSGYPAFSVERRGGQLRVFLADVGVPDGEHSDRADMSASGGHTVPTVSDLSATAVHTAQLAERVAALERERERLTADKAWLQEEVERRGTELGEMRRLLGNAQAQLAEAQQQVRGLLAAPATGAEDAATRPQRLATASDERELPDPSTIARVAKQAGFRGKKARRRLAERLAALVGWRSAER